MRRTLFDLFERTLNANVGFYIGLGLIYLSETLLEIYNSWSHDSRNSGTWH